MNDYYLYSISDKNKQNKTSKRIRKVPHAKKKSPLKDEFFENIFNLELEFHITLDKTLINKIVDEYSKAVEYYNSIDDARAKEYQQRITSFFNEPDVKLLLKNNSKPKSINLGRAKSDIQTRINFMENVDASDCNKLNQEKAFNMLNSSNNQSGYKNIMQSELQKQANDFRQKLKMKKFKKNLSNDFSHSVHNSIKETLITGTKLMDNKSRLLERAKNISDELMEYNSNLLSSEYNDNNNYEFNTSFIIKEEDDEDDKIDDFENKSKCSNKNSVTNSLSEKHSLNTETNDTGNVISPAYSKSSQVLSGIKNYQKFFDLIESCKNIGPKQQKGLLDLKNILDNYINEFNNYYYEDIFIKYVRELDALLNDKFAKQSEVHQSYFAHLKEVKSEISLIEDKESPLYAAMKSIYDKLIEDQQTDLDKVDKLYDNKIQELQQLYKHEKIASNNGLSLIEEKFRLSMCTKMSELIFLNKNNN